MFVALVLMAIAARAPAQDDPLTPSEMDDPGTISGAGTLPLDGLDVWNTFRPRFSFVYDAGKGIGYQNSFASLEAFVPLAQPHRDRLWFADFRGLFNKDGATGGNIGFGRRQFCPWLNATLGAHLYYDYRETAANHFQQLSPGFDILTDCWEFRANGYLPTVFDDRKSAPHRDFFHGNSLYLGFDTALTGADMELGVPVPLCDRFQPKLLGGLYCFDGPEHDRFWGWRARVEGQLSDAVSLHLSVQNDPLFDTTVSFAVAVRFPGGALMRPRPLTGLLEGLLSYPLQRRADERLTADVRRLQNIVIDDTEETLAINPATGQPLQWLHVAAGGNSDGSFEDPYATLTKALRDERYLAGNIDVIYVRSGFHQSVTHTGDFGLVDGTQLLSNGPVQMIDTQLGPRMLPYSGIDPVMLGLPIIEGQVTMGNQTKLSGFEVQSEPGSYPDGLVWASAVDRFVISENVIASAPTDGILLYQINGTGTVSGNRISDCDDNGVTIAESPAFSGDIKNNEITDNGFIGIFVSNSTMAGDVTGNRLLNNDFDGVSITDSTYSGTIRQNTIDRNGVSGITLFDTNFDGRIEENRITGNFAGTFTDAELSRIFRVEAGRLLITHEPDRRGHSGIAVFGSTSATNARILSNEISNFENGGIELQTNQSATFDGEISDNQIDSTLFGVVSRSDGAPTQIEVDLRRNTVTKSEGGILLEGTIEDENGYLVASVPYQGDIDANTVSNLQKFGMRVWTASFEGNITNNVAENGTIGIDVVCFGEPGMPNSNYFKGRISGNTVNEMSSGDLDNVDFGGEGIGFYADTVQGDSAGDFFTDNITLNNAVTGVYIGGGTINGNITGNRAEGNTLGMELSALTHYSGQVANNTANQNWQDGISIQTLGGDWTGEVSRNTASNNGGAGLYVSFDYGGRFVGNVSHNVANGNGSGIRIVGESFSSAKPRQFIGNIENNQASNNASSGIIVGIDSSFAGRNKPVSVNGMVTGNVTDSNERHGVELLGAMAGEFANNKMRDNTKEGLGMEITANSDINMHDNEFSGNNTGENKSGTEAILINAVTSTLSLELTGNESLNSSSGLDDPNNKPFNFDLLNTGGGAFNVTPSTVSALNAANNGGTVGSSDGSVFP